MIQLIFPGGEGCRPPPQTPPARETSGAPILKLPELSEPLWLKYHVCAQNLASKNSPPDLPEMGQQRDSDPPFLRRRWSG